MAMTLQLTDSQIEELRQLAYPLCGEADVEVALGRYPGKLGFNDIGTHDTPINSLTLACLKQIGLENVDFARSFMLRLIEQKWDMETLRRGVVGAVPALVRPPRGFEAQVAVLCAALTAMAERLPAKLALGQIGDAALFGRFCKARAAIEAMVAAFSQFAVLKSAHDGLHMLQVVGADWLDTFGSDGVGQRTLAPLLMLLARVEEVAAADTLGLPETAVASLVNCAATVHDARRRLGTGDTDETAFACATLRALLMRELPALDAEMFRLSRDFPLRALCSLFVGNAMEPVLDEALLAAIDLADTLRRRLMEHALWQAADLTIYALEQALAQPTAVFVTQAPKLLPWLLRDLRVLLDPASAADVAATMNEAVLRHILATDRRQPGPDDWADAGATLEGVKHAFASLRHCARSAFLRVDQAMQTDFSRLLALQAPLRQALDRVPTYCDMLVPL